MFTYETDERLKQMAIAAVKAEKITGYPPVVLLSQWAVESDWGKKETGAFNFWGIKRVPDQEAAKLCATTEDLTSAGFAQLRRDEQATVTRTMPIGNGITRFWLSCWFAAYSSLEESVAAYIHFILSNSRYHEAWAHYQLTKDPDALLQGIARAGYATGRGYADLLLTVEHQENINHAVFMARKETAVTAVVAS